MEAWAALSFKLIRPCVFAFVYFRFNFSALLSKACFWALLCCIFISNSFCFCIKLCLFAYFSLNCCVGLFMLTYFRTLAFGWPLFCFTKFLWMYDILFRNCLDLFGFLCSFANVWHISCVLSDFFIYFYLFVFNLFHVDNKIEYIY